MSSIKSSVGTPLDDVEALDQEARARLAALSVTTAEELLGLMKADPERTAEFLGVDNLTPLANDVGRVASASATPDLSEAPDAVFSTGAAPPEGTSEAPVALEDVERRIGAEPAGAGDTGAAGATDVRGPVQMPGDTGIGAGTPW